MALHLLRAFSKNLQVIHKKTAWYFLTTQLYPNVRAYHSHYLIQDLKEVRAEWVTLLDPIHGLKIITSFAIYLHLLNDSRIHSLEGVKKTTVYTSLLQPLPHNLPVNQIKRFEKVYKVDIKRRGFPPLSLARSIFLLQVLQDKMVVLDP